MNSSDLKALYTRHEASLYLIFRLFLGGLFIYASLDKIWHPALFAKAISNYRILPLPLLHIAAITMPWLELLTGIALIINRFPRSANLLILSMLIVFTLGIISALARGLDFNCGCFELDSTASSIGLFKVLQNIALITMSFCIERILQRRSPAKHSQIY